MKAETIKKLREIKRHILEEPKRLDMWVFLRHLTERTPKRERERFPACGTVGCIAGWAVVLGGKPKTRYGRVRRVAQRLLELDDLQARQLFYHNFPIGFRVGTRDYARAVARRIEHFIATDGAE